MVEAPCIACDLALCETRERSRVREVLRLRASAVNRAASTIPRLAAGTLACVAEEAGVGEEVVGVLLEAPVVGALVHRIVHTTRHDVVNRLS